MQRKLIPAFVAVTLTVFSLPHSGYSVGSAGYENASYSAKTLGQANAVVARPQDPSTALFNPAGLVELEGIQIMPGIQGLHWGIYHKSHVNGDHLQNNFGVIPLPSFWLSVNPGDALPGDVLDNRLAFGFGANAPFGLRNHFPAEDPVADVGYINTLEMMAFTMAAAYRVNDWLSVGGGAVNYYVFDYGFKFNYPNSFILGTAAADGLGFTTTNGFGWGWILGILLEPIEHHKIGVSYRSRAHIDVHGRARIEDLVLGGAQGFPTFPHFETAAHSDIPIPQNVTVGYAYEPSDKWAVELDLGWTDWSDFADQDHLFDNPNAVLTGLGTIPKNAEDTISVHLGGHYRVNEKWDLYGGYLFYEAAIPKQHVDFFIPDAHRHMWSAGFTYSMNEHVDIDFNYIFMLFGRRHISNPQNLARTGSNIDGRFTSIIHGPMLSATIKFDFPFSNGGQDPDIDAGALAAA